jgi:hypothetical protein
MQARRLARTAGWVIAYITWNFAFRLLMLTFITYFLTSSARLGQRPKFEEISDALSANELSLLGLGAALFVLMLRGLYPIASTTTKDIFTPARFERYFAPGFAHGALLSAGVTLAFLLSGNYRYLGFFIQFDDAPMAAITVLFRMMALGALAYFEEYIFRHKISRGIEHQLWGTRPVNASARFGVTIAVAILYCLVKCLQFDFSLGITQVITLFLVSMVLSIRAISDNDFGRGAGFWAAMLIIFQPLLGLPILGSEFNGVLLIKYQPGETADGLTRFFTGGAGGPLSSFALQIFLAVDVARGWLAYLERRKLRS